MNTRTSKKRAAIAVLSILLLAALSGCAYTVSFAEAATKEPVGFWHGLWHGIISPIAWICSLFSEDVAIYAIYNNGGWYDFGFILGIGALGGGASSSQPTQSILHISS